MASEESEATLHGPPLNREDRGGSTFLTSRLGVGGLLSSELRAARLEGDKDLEHQRNLTRERLEEEYAQSDEAREIEAMRGLDSRKARRYRRRHHPSKEGKEMKMSIAFGAFWNSRGEDELGANLRSYGSGISFYFKWLKWMAMIFFLLAVLQVPIFVANLGGASYFDFLLSPVASLSLGNLFTEEFFGVDIAELTNATFSSQNSGSVAGPAKLALQANFLCDLLGLERKSNVTGGCFVDQESLLVFYSGWDAACILLFMLMTWLALHYSTVETAAFEDASKVLKVEDYSVEVIIPAKTNLDTVRAHFERVAKDKVFEVNIVDTGGKLIEVALAEDEYRKDLLRMYGLAKGLRMRSIQEVERANELRESMRQGSCCSRLSARFRLFVLTRLRCSILKPIRRYLLRRRIERLKKKLERIHPRVELQWLRVLGETGVIAGSTVESAEGSDGDLKESINKRTAKKRVSRGPSYVSAYVTFYDMEAKRRVLRLYKRRIFAAIRSQKEELRLEGKFPLIVTNPPPPNTLLWQNVGYSKTQKRLRACCAFVSVFILFCVTAAISLYLETFQDFVVDLEALPALNGLSKSIDDVCGGIFAGDRNGTEVEETLAGQPGVLSCLCDQVLLGLIAEQAIQQDLLQDGAVCSEFASGKTQTLLIQFGATIATLVVNTIIFLLLEATADFMKFTSVLQRELTIMTRIFVLTLINSAFVILLVNADFHLDIDLLLIGGGSFADFSTGWFENVGFTIVLVATLNVLAPHLFPLLIAFYYKVINNDLVKRGRAFDQTQYNTMMLGPDFRLSIRYAQILAMIFLVLMYSSGMPILYPIMCISLLVTYAVDKFMFIKICRRPPAYTTYFGDWSIYMLENAVLLHVIVGVWMYTSPRLFPATFRESAIAIVESLQQRFQDEAATSLGNFLSTTGEDPSGIQGSITRFTSPQAVPLLVVAAVIALVKVLRVFEATRKAARVVQLWVVEFIIKPLAKFWNKTVLPAITRACLAIAEFYEKNKDSCKPKSISLWRPGASDDESEDDGSTEFDSDSGSDSDDSSGFDSDSDTDDDIEDGDAEETIALKRAARKRRREERAARREVRRQAKQERKEKKAKEKEERRRARLEAIEKRRAEKERLKQEKEAKVRAKQERLRQRIEEKFKKKEAALEAKRLKEEEKERKKKEKEEAAAAKLKAKQDKIEAARKKKEEEAEAKVAKAEAKRLAIEQAKQQKQDDKEAKALAKVEAKEAKERAKQEAADAKVAKAQAKVDAKEAREREKELAKQRAEDEKIAKAAAKVEAKEAIIEAREALQKQKELAKQRAADEKLAKALAKVEAKEARERAKIEAKEAKARAKIQAKETKEQAKERKRLEAEQAREAKERARIQAKESKEQEKERKRIEAEQAKEAKERAKQQAKESKEKEKERKLLEAEQAKERKRLEAEQAKEALAQAKIEAKEAKERAKVEAQEEKERLAREAKEAKERAKVDALEAKERAKIEAKEAKERARVEALEAKERAKQEKIEAAQQAAAAKAEAKLRAKQERIDQKLRAKQARIDAKLEEKQRKIEEKQAAREAKLAQAAAAREAKEEARKQKALEKQERAIQRRLQRLERYDALKANCASFFWWVLGTIIKIITFILVSIPVFIFVEPCAWQYRRYKKRREKLLKLRERRALEEARLKELRAEDRRLRAENPEPPITLAYEHEWIAGFRSYNLKYNPKYVRMLQH